MKKLSVILFILAFASPCFAQQAFYDVTQVDGNGIRFWLSDWYKIHMGNTSEYHYGPVTDYSIKTNMNPTAGRGWTWGIMSATPVAALSNTGSMQIAGTFTSANFLTSGTAGVGTLTPRGRFDVDGGGDIYLSDDPEGSSAQTIYFPGHIFIAPYNGGNIAYLQARRGGSTGTTSLRLRTYNAGTLTDAMHIEGNGNVGIGTTAPSSWFPGKALEISDVRPILKLSSTTTTGISTLLFTNTAINSTSHLGEFHVNYQFDQAANDKSLLNFYAYPGGTILSMQSSGNVGIGTTNTGTFKLAVEGKIGAREVNVTATSPWPDYVLKKEYELMSLAEVENFIQMNGHLPGLPDQKEVADNGLDLGKMNAILLKKIEELTLHLIKQQKQIDALKKSKD